MDTTVAELLRQAVLQLPGSDSARLDAELLLCAVTGLERPQLYADPVQDIGREAAVAFRAQVRERQNGVPVAYLTGVKEFWSMTFKVNAHALIPRPETECLVEAVLERVPHGQTLRIAELGTGCGAIALALARERPACDIVATDISRAALAVARDNARRQQLHQVKFMHSDWFSAFTGKFDLIVSNPPYVRDDDELLHGSDLRHEPRLALCGGTDGLDAMRRITRDAGRYLVPNGWLCLEHGSEQGAAVRALFMNHDYMNVTTIRDHAGRERATCGRLAGTSGRRAP